MPIPPDPYAPPRVAVERATTPQHAPGKPITPLYAAVLATSILARFVALITSPPIAKAARELALVSASAASVLALAWLYAAWKGVPESHRGTVTPRRAWGSMFIPLYNAYWAIAVNVALCNTLDGILERNRSSRRAPRALAVIASGVWLVTYVVQLALASAHFRFVLGATSLFAVVKGGLWIAYMVQCDKARDEVARLGDDYATLGMPRLSAIQREPGPGIAPTIVMWFVMIVVGLGCWQILSPGEAGSRGHRPARSSAGAR